jgi:Putative bacterial sensory transduction regulator
MRSLLGAALLLIATAANAAPAATPSAPVAVFQTGISRVELTAVLSSHGLTVSDSTTKDSDPWLLAKTPKGTEFYVNMYDCAGDGADGRRCNNLQFLAQWELTKNASVDSANAYNQKFVFGRAYLNKEGTRFMFDYSISIKDGVTVGNLKRHVDNWLRVLDDVRAQLKV